MVGISPDCTVWRARRGMRGPGSKRKVLLGIVGGRVGWRRMMRRRMRLPAQEGEACCSCFSSFRRRRQRAEALALVFDRFDGV